jgi:hypothetical protein
MMSSVPTAAGSTPRSAARRSGRPGDGGPRATAVVTAWTVALVGVIVWPMASRGWMLLLDWTPGPRTEPFGALLDRSALPSGPLMYLLTGTVQTALGAAVGWLPFALALVALGLGASRLVTIVDDGRGRGPLLGPATLARLAAATAAVWNPFVYDRLYAGHLNVLLGCALLPYLVHAAVAARSRLRAGWSAAVPTAAWWWAATAVTLHLFWVGLVLVCATTATHARHQPRAALRWGGTVVVVTVLGTLLWLAVTSGTVPVAGNADTRETFAPRADPHLGLTLTLAAQGGFWRTTPGHPGPPGIVWTVSTGALWAVAAVGAARARHSGAGPTVAVLGIAAGAGLLAAHGTAGPLGPVFGAALDHLPGFGVMREPGKFLALVSLAVAVCFGQGVGLLAERAGRQGRWIAAALLAVPLLGSAPLALGLDGRLTPSRFPASWTAARDAVDAGDGPALLLPVGTYVDPGFTGGRIVAEPAAGWFGDQLVVADDPGVPGLSASDPLGAAAIELIGTAPRERLARALHDAGFRQVVAVTEAGVSTVRDPVTGTDPVGFEAVLDDGSVVVWRLAP